MLVSAVMEDWKIRQGNWKTWCPSIRTLALISYGKLAKKAVTETMPGL